MHSLFQGYLELSFEVCIRRKVGQDYRIYRIKIIRLILALFDLYLLDWEKSS